MDRQSLEYTREHYNKHSNQFATTKEALAARSSGPSAPLKKLHNTIKRLLIKRFAGQADRLLDLACGRGGDIWKWIDAGIRQVKGIDLSPHEVDEAGTRFAEARAKRPELELDYSFVATPELGLSEWKEPAPYDAVTCMFAAHYFFVSEAALKQFLHNVSINLVQGGYFFGTVPDGRRVNDCVLAGQGMRFHSPMLTVEARWKGAPECFGSAYICAIGDTVTGAEKGTDGSLEYLVYSSVFVTVAAQFGLEPVLDYDMPELSRLLDPADRAKPLKHFAPRFPQSDPSLERASRLFATFVFQKRRPYPAGAAEPPQKRARADGGEQAIREDAAAQPAARRRIVKPAAPRAEEGGAAPAPKLTEEERLDATRMPSIEQHLRSSRR